MNFEKNGQQSDKNRQGDDSHLVDDDVKLTALAMGENLDPAEANRLQVLLEKDESKRKEFESTSHLASMIRDSVENDLPLAPGSIHDVVVAALSGKGVTDVEMSDPTDSPTLQSNSRDGDGAVENRQAAMVVPRSPNGKLLNGKLYYYVTAASVAIVAFSLLYFPDWNGEPVNVAQYNNSESRELDESASSKLSLRDSENDQSGANSFEVTANKELADQSKTGQPENYYKFMENKLGAAKSESAPFGGQSGKADSPQGLASGNKSQPLADTVDDNKSRNLAANEGLNSPGGLKADNPLDAANKSRNRTSSGLESKKGIAQRRMGNSETKPALVPGEAAGGGLGGGGGFGGAPPTPKYFQNGQSRGGRSKAPGSSDGSAGSGGAPSNNSLGKNSIVRGFGDPNQRQAMNRSSNAVGNKGSQGQSQPTPTNKPDDSRVPESRKGGMRGADYQDKDFAEREPGSKLLRKVQPPLTTGQSPKSDSAVQDPKGGDGKPFGRDGADRSVELKQKALSKKLDPQKELSLNAGLSQDSDGALEGSQQSSGSGKRTSDFDARDTDKKSNAKMDAGKKGDEKKIEPAKRESPSFGLAEANDEKNKLVEQLGAIKQKSADKGKTVEADDLADKEAQAEARNNEKSSEEAKGEKAEEFEKAPARFETLKKEAGEFEKIRLDFPRIDPKLENEFIQPIGTKAVSTFSIDTDTASYTNVRQMLRAGRLPHPEDVRIEEMINYFDFKYEQPKPSEPFSVNMEVATAPWNPGNKILKIGLQAREVTNESRPPSNLVFLVDVSGSMRANNKLPLLKSGLKQMVQKLREDDYVSIVTYSDQIKTVLDPTDGSQKDKIIGEIDKLNAAGSTNGGEGLQTAYRLAEKNLLKKGTNRIVLGTDGDFNVGIQNDEELATFVKEKAQSGVFLTVCGFGSDNFKDKKMEMMADNGNGKVYFIDSAEEAQRVFADRISGSLVSIAANVKLQMLFNPRMVQSYRLIGYENRIMAAQDFDDDTKDGGEMDAGDSVTALYEIVPGDGDFKIPTSVENKKTVDLKYQVLQEAEIKLTKVAASDDIAALRINYMEPGGTTGKQLEFVVKNKDLAFNRASKEFQLATAVAGLGMMLRGSQHRGGLNYDNLKEFGQTVLADRPVDAKDSTTLSESAKEATSKQVELRKKQRMEVLELIDRAAKIYENGGNGR